MFFFFPILQGSVIVTVLHVGKLRLQEAPVATEDVLPTSVQMPKPQALTINCPSYRCKPFLL